MKNKELNKHPYFSDIQLNVKSIFAICLGIFLFLLFFQPFNLKNPDFNGKLLTLAAFGGISLILLGILRVLIPDIAPTLFQKSSWNTNKEIIYGFIFVVLNSVAYSFFARYVGKIPITFHAETIIVIMGISAIVILVTVNKFHYLKNQVKELSKNTKTIIEKEQPRRKEKIEFESENKSEFFQLFLDQLILIKSANNYIEVIYQNNDKRSKKLIRNTLKNTEVLLQEHPDIIRCHRSCMVNKNYILEAQRGSDGLQLKLDGYEKEIHVSRQYVLKVKEALRSVK